MRDAAASAILLGLLLSATSVLAASPPAPSSSIAADRLRASFEALPEADRRALQDALLWSGDFVGVVSGVFGPRTRDALAEFARRGGIQAEAVLAPVARAKLLAAAASARQEVGFAPVRDKPAGIALSLPLKILPRRTSTEGGARFAAADSGIVVDVLSRAAGLRGLAEVFDRMSGPSDQRKVTYKLLRPDFFVVSGEIGERKFYSRFVIGTLDGISLVRGLSFTYPKVDAGRLDRIVLAAAASFDAFPSVAPSKPAAIIPAVPTPPAVPSVPASFTRSAVRVGTTAALTHLSSTGCDNARIGEVPIRLLGRDPESGLALFSVPAAPGSIATFAASVPVVGLPALALFRRGSEGWDAASVIIGEVDSVRDRFTVSAGIQGEPNGVPIIDREGRLLGLLATPASPATQINGVRLQADYPAVTSFRLARFLGEAGVPPQPSTVSSPVGVSAVAAAWRSAILTVTCQAPP